MSSTTQFLALAQEELETAELLQSNSRYRACVSRSYYAMYYAATALLISRNFSSRTHKGVIQLFSQHFVKTGDFSSDSARSLSDAYDLRQMSDYEENCVLTADQVTRVLDSARSFVNAARDFLV